MRNERFPVPGSRFPVWFAVLAAGALVSAQAPAPADPYRSVAEQYVKLVLAVGQHDGDYVDAFYGPPEWLKEAEAAKKPLAAIDAQAAAVETELAGIAVKPDPRDAEMWGLRRQYLTRQLAALRSRVAMLKASGSRSMKSRWRSTMRSRRSSRCRSSRPCSSSSMPS